MIQNSRRALLMEDRGREQTSQTAQAECGVVDRVRKQ